MAKLGLKSILCVAATAATRHVCSRFYVPTRTLVLEEYPAATQTFMDHHGIQLLQFGMPGNKVSVSCLFILVMN